MKVNAPINMNVAVSELCAQLGKPEAYVSILTLVERAAAVRLDREVFAWELFLRVEELYPASAFEVADAWIAEVERQRKVFAEEMKRPGNDRT